MGRRYCLETAIFGTQRKRKYDGTAALYQTATTMQLEYNVYITNNRPNKGQQMITICVLFFLAVWSLNRWVNKLEQKRFEKFVDAVVEALKKESETYQDIIKEKDNK